MCMVIVNNMKRVEKNIKIRLNYMSDKVFLLMFGSPNVKIFDKS